VIVVRLDDRRRVAPAGLDRQESGRSSTVAPRARSSEVTVARRSDSFTRRFATFTISTGDDASGAIAASVGTTSGVALQSNVPPCSASCPSP
jgi:hypothetical protein